MKIILVLLFLISCAEQRVIEKVENDDFSDKTEYRYNSDEDYLGEVYLKFRRTLSDESLTRFTSKDLKLISSRDPLIQGLVHCYNNNRSKAFRLYDKNYRKIKGRPEYWNQLGSCYLLNKDYYQAMLYYENSQNVYAKATKSKKTYVPVLNNLGVLYLKMGDERKALATFIDANKKDRTIKTVKYNLAQMYLRFGVINKANKLFLELIKEDQNDVEVNAALANINLINNRLKKSSEYFAKISKINYEKPYIGINYAFLLGLENNILKAIEVFDDVDSPKDTRLQVWYKKVESFLDEKKKAYDAKLDAEKKLKAKAKKK